MKNTLKKLISIGCLFTMLFSNTICSAYADEIDNIDNIDTIDNNDNIDNANNNTSTDSVTRASNYIIAYSGTLSKSGSNSIYFTSMLDVYNAGCTIIADVYRNGSFYDSYIKSTSSDTLVFNKNITVPSGTYYVEFSYDAMVNGISVEGRTKTTSSVII